MISKSTLGKFIPVRPAAMAAVLFACLTGTAAAVTQLDEEHFDFGVTGWSAAGAPETEVTWDGETGSPAPGSLLLSAAAEAGQDTYKAVGQCQAAKTNRHYSVKAQINPELGNRSGSCFAVPVFYDQADCQGEGSVTGTGDAADTGGWRREISTLLSFTTTQSVRVELVMTLNSGSGPAACRFDTVGFYEGRLAEVVPAVSLPGLAILAAGLGLGAVFSRKRRRWS